MSKIEWSKNQQAAIDYIASNLLISAGAGSGKTAVLTERIYQLVKNGADLSRFLVLTFTNAASAEMKTRIRKALMKDDDLKHLTSKLETAHIETFDAFALFLVKKYAFRIGVSPNIQIIDQNILDIQRLKIRDEIITYLYSIRDSAFLDLISRYCTKNDEQIRNYIIDICKYVESKANKYEYIDNFIDKYFDLNRLNGFIDDKYNEMVDTIKAAIKNANGFYDPENETLLIDSLQSLLDNGKDYDSLTQAIDTYSLPRFKGKEDSAIRGAIKDLLSKSFIKFSDYDSRENIINNYLETKSYVKTLLDIVRKIEKKLDEFKEEKKSYSFSDIAFKALSVLEIPEVREEMRNYFQYILVDEYQDTSILQELVVNALAKDNVCMVGDVKQSIYRFRGADCSLFQYKYALYKDNKGGHLIDLNTSYRSRKEVVDLVNEMFERLMDKESNPIDYKDGHHFEYGFNKYDSLIDNKENYFLKIYRYPITKEISPYKQETELIALDIINKINKGYKVFDKEVDGLRPCSFKDFAVIMDSGKKFDEMKKILSEHGIPVKVFYDEPVKDFATTQVLKNLLILLDGCLKDDYQSAKFLHAYVSIARSFVCEERDELIYRTIKDSKIEESKIIKKINSFKEDIRYSPLSEIIKRLIKEFDIYRNAIKLTHFSGCTNKIELFVALASSMDDLGYTLDDFIQYFDDINSFKFDIPYVDTDVGEDSVTFITMHRSKGLEYPFVYLPVLTSNFNKSNATAFLIDDDYGAVLPLVGRTDKSSLFNHLIKSKEAVASFEERLRLFYVAITRARERLIMFYGDKTNGDSLLLSPVLASNFRGLIHYLGFEDKYGVYPELPYQMLEGKTTQLEDKIIKEKFIDVEPEEIDVKKASKDLDDAVSQSLLEFGNEIHYLLEIANFETKDLSYILSPKVRKYISNVLSAKVFENVKNSQVLHEYSFFDEKNNVNGVIDCLVKKDNEVGIVDFKLKHLDDEKYVLQLHTYRDYIKQITDLPIKLYLISAITGEVKEIE